MKTTEARMKQFAIVVLVCVVAYLALGFVLTETMTDSGFVGEILKPDKPTPIRDKLANIVLAPVAFTVMVVFWLGGYR